MMKKLIYVLFFLTTLCSCQENGKSNEKENQMKIVNQIPKDQQITYAIHVNAMTPYEMYLDDILIDFFYEDNMNNTTELNPYLLENGKHKLKIRFLPTISDIFSKKGLLDPRDIRFNKDSRWHVYFVTLNKDPDVALGYTNEIDYGNSELPIIPPPSEVPFWEQEWELDIKDLPYTLEGWKNSQDLSKMDTDQLQKEVLSFFEKQRNLLNEGKTDEYLKLGEKKDKEIIIATYDENTSWYSSKERIDNLLKAKENMLPLENYRMTLYADGKLVTLEIALGKYKNWSALISKNDKYGINDWSILLHKPQGSNEFEIIRK